MQIICNRLEARSKANVEKIISKKKERKGKSRNTESMFEEGRKSETVMRNLFRKDK